MGFALFEIFRRGTNQTRVAKLTTTREEIEMDITSRSDFVTATVYSRGGVPEPGLRTTTTAI